MDVICKNIYFLRMQYSLTQKDMADILGISINSLRKLENGSIPRTFRAGAICRLCNHFQLSADAVLRTEIT